MTDPAACSLTIDPEDHDGMVVARLAGELDAASAPATKEGLAAVVPAGGRLVVDLAEVGFMDSSGLGVLVGTLRSAREQGATFEVRDPQPRVAKLIESAGLAELFSLAGAETPAPSPGSAAAAPSDVEELRSLLLGYENLLRWGDLTPEQVTVALRGEDIADATTDLALATRVRDALLRLGVNPPPPAED